MKTSKLQEILENSLSQCTYFHQGNVNPSCKVFNVDTKEEIPNVLGVDTEGMFLIKYVYPFSVANGEFETYEEKYTTIYPIYAGEPVPVMFHCYGKLEENN